MPKLKIAPSILSADQERLQEEINEIEDYSDLLQVDVMDNVFVPNVTPQAELLKKFNTKVPLDIHLMVKEPGKGYMKSFIKANPKLKINNITVHYEACEDVGKTLDVIRELGMKPSVAINPKTPLDSVKSVLDKVEMVLIMTVNPGFSGQGFLEEPLGKVKELRSLMPEIDIQVDGGINDKTAALAVKAGANVLVASSFIFKAEDKVRAIKKLRSSWKKRD